MDIPTPVHDLSGVVELRQYTLKPGRRDEFIELFDSTFIESQEATGARLLGQFRDREKPDRFVWLRGFDDMPARARVLETFYGGPVWRENRDRANDMMLETEDVLLLKPVKPRSGLPQTPERPAISGSKRVASIVTATIYLLTSPVNDDFRGFFDDRVSPVVESAGAAPVARYETEHAPNNFPRLPVRTGEHAFVWFATFPDDAALRAYQARLAAAPQWREQVAPALRNYLAKPEQLLVLEPTTRSRLRHVAPFGFTMEGMGAKSDFDFIAGEWRVQNRQLSISPDGTRRWQTFPATHSGRLHLGGIANVDEMEFPEPRGRGMTVRSFDLARRQWSIYWIASRDGVMGPPVVGGFSGSRGEFYGLERNGDQQFKVRFIWTKDGADRARWEQAFSYDDATWETNWIMDFSRGPAPHR